MGASLENDIVAFIKSVYGEREIQVSFNRLPQSIKAAKSIRSISFSRVPDDAGDGVCLVGIQGQGGSDTNVYVPFKVQIKKQLYTLKTDVKKGDIIRHADVAVKEAHVQGSAAGHPTGIEEVAGKMAKKDLFTGQVLTKQMLQEQMMIAKGEIVNMTAENSRLVIQAKGVALEKGGLGDLVRVKSASGREIVGRVIGSNSIDVGF